MSRVGTIRVDVDKLKADAQRFQVHADELKSKTDAMLQLVEQSKGFWEDDAQVTYSTKFAGLSNAMQTIFKMCSQYSIDINDIALNTNQAMNDTKGVADSMKADVELNKY